MRIKIHFLNGHSIEVTMEESEINRIFKDDNEWITLDHPGRRLIINPKNIVYIEEQ